MKKNLIRLALLLAFVPALASAFSFPELGFCPLGGPPGWFNRMTGQHHKRYYYPAQPMRAPLPPTGGRYAYPVSVVTPYYPPAPPLYRR